MTEEEIVVLKDGTTSFDREIAEFDSAVAMMLHRIQDISSKFLLSSSEAEACIDCVISYKRASYTLMIN